MLETDTKCNLIVKWSGKEYKLSELDCGLSVGALKQAIQDATGVRPERQKLLNIKFRGKPAEDDCKLAALNLKDGFKIMMMGSLEEEIEQINTPIENDTVVNDLDLTEEEMTLDNKIYQEKIERRIDSYKVNILNPPRKNRKLLVLDIDYTIFDHRSTAETAAELMRPHLHEFLGLLYPYYDIMFWSATNMKWIVEKLRMLGVSNNPNYKITCYYDSAAMISVESAKNDIVDVKPLAVIWAHFPQYSAKNTVMLDDIRHNFLMNPQSGLRIRPFRQAHFNRATDNELVKLTKYLKYIAVKNVDFTRLNHRHWESYISHAKDLNQVLAHFTVELEEDVSPSASSSGTNFDETEDKTTENESSIPDSGK